MFIMQIMVFKFFGYLIKAIFKLPKKVLGYGFVLLIILHFVDKIFY